MSHTHNLGFPRIGLGRELKFATERYWKGRISVDELEASAAEIRRANWKRQIDAGIDLIPVGDFSLYDHVLDMSLMLEHVPPRFKPDDDLSDLDRYFRMARGRSREGSPVAACEMTKWFDTNYHYIVPEFDSATTFQANPRRLLEQVREAQALNASVKPVLVGPVTYLFLGKSKEEGFDKLGLLEPLVDAYGEIFEALSKEGVEWVQVDEPILGLDLSPAWRAAVTTAYTRLARAPGKKLLAVYFAPLRDNLETVLSLPVEGIHVDAVRGAEDVPALLERVPAEQVLSLGVVDGRNVWRADLERLLTQLEGRGTADGWAAPGGADNTASAAERAGGANHDGATDSGAAPGGATDSGAGAGPAPATDTASAADPAAGARPGAATNPAPSPTPAAGRGDNLWLAPSCSLLHVPIDLDGEKDLDPEIAGWLAFGVQKLRELSTLSRALNEGRDSVAAELHRSSDARDRRRDSEARRNKEVQRRLESVTEDDLRRRSPYADRAKTQHDRFGLPLFPTTTIGSFPQTPEIRKTRRKYKRGNISLEEYNEFLKGRIASTIEEQEAVGLDVLVHGEAERNDMVEYFGEQLSGYTFTANGWVQSFGSRCVKPPIIYGDVSRPEPMTVDWITYAQSCTSKPVKGMLTGPITMLQWAFVRDDQPRQLTARQIALALRDEVADLERAGIPVIQVDEPALREGLPLRRGEWAGWLSQATANFRLATTGVADRTQVHTHMCYSEFNDIIESIADLDADVITIEAARSDMELLDAFNDFEYPNEIGPGVYDIHSPNVPDTEVMVDLMRKAAAKIPAERLWVNPDCGLKTRRWEEVRPSLENMVAAAQILRREFG